MGLANQHILGSVALALLMLAFTTALHYEGLKLLAGAGRSPLSRPGPVFAITVLVALHLAEIGLYAGAYALGIQVLQLGALHGVAAASSLDYFYFAAETYSTLGYGDVVPTGALRLVVSVEALNGLLLLAWSGAFLFRLLDEPDRGRALLENANPCWATRGRQGGCDSQSPWAPQGKLFTPSDERQAPASRAALRTWQPL